MDSPPDYVIERARKAAIQSPCEKSKRGVAIYDPESADRLYRNSNDQFALEAGTFTEQDRRRAEQHTIIAEGHNGQPPPFMCSGSDLCRRDCAQLCLHAEDRAIRAATNYTGGDLSIYELVHVKVVNGEVVPGKGPGCAQCSRLVVETDLRGVWLFEQTDCPSGNCPLCTGEMCMQCETGPARPLCEHGSVERHEGRQPPQGEWVFYEPERFHRLTLAHLQLGDPR